MGYRSNMWSVVAASAAMLASLLAWVPSASAMPVCASTITTETQLADCILTYNAAPAGTITTVNMSADVTLSANLPQINNATSAILIINGNGRTVDGAGLANEVLFQLDGVLLVSSITLTGANLDGVAIWGGAASIDSSTITGNGWGVNANSQGGTTIDNSTLAFNSVDGLLVGNSDLVTVRMSTISSNFESGIRAASTSTVEIQGSLVARNTLTNCYVAVDDLGGNVFGDTTCNGIETPGLASSLAATLDFNGCSAPCTQTLASLPKSPAINAAGSCGFGLDQRGVSRTVGACDAGAFEFEIPEELCHNKVVTHDLNYLPDPVVATSGDDVFRGTPGDDRIVTRAGDDTVCAGDGNDLIKTGSGNDVAFAEDGDDEVLGGGGNDMLSGGAGSDVIRGQGGSDNMIGLAGDDRIDGGGAPDLMDGGDGDDTLSGQNGADGIFGGYGNDVMRGQTGPDYMDGGFDDDTLTGGAGNDTLYGGPNNDVCAGNTGPADSAEAASCESTPGVEVLF